MTTGEFQELMGAGFSFSSFHDWQMAKEVATRAVEREQKRCAKVATDHAERHNRLADQRPKGAESLKGAITDYAIGLASAGHEIAREILKEPPPVGDGMTDNTEALQKAIDEGGTSLPAGTGPVYFTGPGVLSEPSIFEIPADKAALVKQWLETHPCSLRGKPEKTAIGGRITYSFTDTSIGQMQSVECACGAKHSVDYNY